MAQGQVIAGRFELFEQIGSGGMGQVWRAWDRKHDREVAVKELTQTGAAMLLRFVREQGLRIEHPHVVAPSGWAADDDTVALSMDLVRGGSVDTLIRDHGALPESYVAVLMHQLVSALTEIHRHGVIHRDIKPANLLVEPTGSDRPCLRVADFGVAVVRDEPRLTETLMSVGTPGYLAPDLATGAEPAPMHDLYAAGIVGQRLLTGARPGELPEQTDFRLWPLLRWMSAADPAQRPRSGEQVLAVMESEHLVPAGTPWLSEEDPPVVFDQLVPSEEAPRATMVAAGIPDPGAPDAAPAASRPTPTFAAPAPAQRTPTFAAPQASTPGMAAEQDRIVPRNTATPTLARRRSLWVVAIGSLAGAAVLLVLAVVLALS